MITPIEALAVIDGALCHVGRAGERAVCHAPLATAIVEFRSGPLRTYVREHPYGLLPGFPNLYCLDGDLRLMWVAEWPALDDLCAVIVDEVQDELIVKSLSGATVRLDALTGRLVSWTGKVEAAG
jgi:hypothetical protein